MALQMACSGHFVKAAQEPTFACACHVIETIRLCHPNCSARWPMRRISHTRWHRRELQQERACPCLASRWPRRQMMSMLLVCNRSEIVRPQACVLEHDISSQNTLTSARRHQQQEHVDVSNQKLRQVFAPQWHPSFIKLATSAGEASLCSLTHVKQV